MESKQQRARDNALQLQVENLNVGLSATEVENMLKRDRELVMKEMQIIAKEEMDKRLSAFGGIALERIIEAKITDAFADPAIQIFLRDTERAAVSSERGLDYEVLSELLIHRVENKDNYTKKAALKKVVDTISLISDEALLGITLMYLAENVYPTSGDTEEGLKSLEEVFKNIISDNEMPSEQDWIHNLEILGLIKIIPFTSKKTLDDYYFESLNGYFCAGIKKDSEQYNAAIDKLKSVNLPLDLLCQNIILNDYVRLPIYRLKEHDNLRIFDIRIKEFIPLSDEQKKVLDLICDDYDKSTSTMKIVKDKYKELLNEYPEIKKVVTWYNMYHKKYISLDLSGDVLAHCNAKRLDNKLPEIK